MVRSHTFTSIRKSIRTGTRIVALCVAVLALIAASATAQDGTSAQTATASTAPGASAPAPAARISCASEPGSRTHCAADTSQGIALVTSSGNTSCLLGKTWGYDDTGIWVSDGCSGEFIEGHATEQPAKKKPMEHIPNQGFLLYSGDEGEIYLRLFTYARYTNQLNLKPTYVDAFGNTHTVQRRQDVELTKWFSPFSGWFLTPKFRYYLYVWSNNAAQGQPAQTVGAGNISYAFNRFVTFGTGITSLPSTRSTSGCCGATRKFSVCACSQSVRAVSYAGCGGCGGPPQRRVTADGDTAH